MGVPIEYQLKPFILLILFVSLISLNIIYSKTDERIGSKRETMTFRGMLVSYMAYALVDLRLLLGDNFYTMFPRLFVIFVIALGFGSMSFSCYFWFMHVLASSHLKFKPLKIGSVDVGKILMHVPLAVDLLLFFTPLYHLIYDLGEIAVFKPPMMFVLLMDYIYLISATIISVKCAKRAKNNLEKKKYKSQIKFILYFTAGGVLIGFLLNLPAIELFIIPVILKLFVELQDSQIYTDALTKLFTRGRMNEIINEEISSCSTEHPFTLIMIDMDYFKSINDILGHDEGDKALVAFSKALQKALKSKSAVASRWGGDEFVVAGKDAFLTEDFRKTLQEALESSSSLGYVPPFSLGVASCTSPSASSKDLFVEADSALYKDKELQHQKKDEFISKLNSLKL